jgi:hypothetical protein
MNSIYGTSSAEDYRCSPAIQGLTIENRRLHQLRIHECNGAFSTTGKLTQQVQLLFRWLQFDRWHPLSADSSARWRGRSSTHPFCDV